MLAEVFVTPGRSRVTYDRCGQSEVALADGGVGGFGKRRNHVEAI